MQKRSVYTFHDQRFGESLPTVSSTTNTMRKHPLFVAAVALGAFLTFLIQPLAARSLLPAFGGSGSVWVTALVFYQVVLAAGYLLTHFIHTRLALRGQAISLVLLSIGALLTLSVLPKPIDVGSHFPAGRLLLSLAVSVGPPFFVLAVAGPLIQGWATTQSEEKSTGRDVYSLYAISNGASLLALAGYPLVMEPLWGILQQSRIWDGLFAIEGLLLIVISWRIGTANRVAAKQEIQEEPNARTDRTADRPRTLLWLGWSAAGVMVLTSTSGFISQEIAAIPLLWVIPLALYLATWILSFSGAVRPGIVARGCLALIALILIVAAVDIRLSLDFRVKLGFALAGLTLACFAVHASLYELRPQKQQLTRFYAAVAAGGAIGGVLAGLVAVQVFQDWRDLGLAFAVIVLLTCSGLVPRLRTRKIIHLHQAPSFWLVGLLSIGCCILFVVTGMDRPGLLYKHRDFHGLVRVVEEGTGNPQQHRLVMYHGTTIHGCQMLDHDLRDTPTTYYNSGSGAEIAVQAQRAMVGPESGLNIGAVGLGIGTMAAHLRPQDMMHFYEISPAVAEIAQGGSLGQSGHCFRYLSDAAGEVGITVGDARLSLAAELIDSPNGNAYDLLVLDAFAGDSVPTHLLTREAFSLFTKHLSDTGMIAVHVSCNWLDLVPVVYAWADSEQWQALTISTRGNAEGIPGNHSVWMLLFRDQATLRILADQCRPLMATGRIMVQNLRNVSYGDLQPWTDDNTDLLALIRSEIRLRKRDAG
jgi:hypothetical protein